MGILGSSNTTQIGPFFRKETQHNKAELIDQLQATIDFLEKSWVEFLDVFHDEYIRDAFIENRLHAITGVRQQKFKDDPNQDLSYAYMNASSDFDSMPDELYVLLVRERDEEIYAHECPFDAILVTGNNNMDVLGRYIPEDVIGDDCLLHYRRYVKDTEAKGIVCLFKAQQPQCRQSDLR